MDTENMDEVEEGDEVTAPTQRTAQRPIEFSRIGKPNNSNHQHKDLDERHQQHGLGDCFVQAAPRNRYK